MIAAFIGGMLCGALLMVVVTVLLLEEKYR